MDLYASHLHRFTRAYGAGSREAQMRAEVLRARAEARRRRANRIAKTAWNAVSAFHRDVTSTWVTRFEAPAARSTSER